MTSKSLEVPEKAAMCYKQGEYLTNTIVYEFVKMTFCARIAK